MILAPSDPTGAAWNEAVLHGLGAATISHTDEGIVVAPDIDLSGYAAALSALTAAELAVHANLKQWALATSGFTMTLSGQALTFSTDTASQALLTGKYIRLTQANPPATISWQFPSGFVSISMADFQKVASAIADFIQATFDALAEVLAAIRAGTITTVAQVDAAAWPSAVASS